MVTVTYVAILKLASLGIVHLSFACVQDAVARWHVPLKPYAGRLSEHSLSCDLHCFARCVLSGSDALMEPHSKKRKVDAAVGKCSLLPDVIAYSSLHRPV